jgi:hypothetical protein
MDASPNAAPSAEAVHTEPEQSQSQLEVVAPPEDPKPKKPKAAPKPPPNAERPPGKSLLPFTRVQRITKADKARFYSPYASTLYLIP